MIDLTASSLVPLLLASLTALITATALMGDGNILTPPDPDLFRMANLPLYVLLGTLCGAGSVVFSRLYLGASAAVSWPSSRLRIWAGGAVIGGSILLFPSLYGEGYEVVNALFKGHAEVLASDMSMRRIDPEGWTLVD